MDESEACCITEQGSQRVEAFEGGRHQGEFLVLQTFEGIAYAAKLSGATIEDLLKEDADGADLRSCVGCAEQRGAIEDGGKQVDMSGGKSQRALGGLARCFEGRIHIRFCLQGCA